MDSKSDPKNQIQLPRIEKVFSLARRTSSMESSGSGGSNNTSEEASTSGTSNLATAQSSVSEYENASELSIPDLPLPLDENLNVDYFVRNEFRRDQYVSRPPQKLITNDEFVRACLDGDVETVRYWLCARDDERFDLDQSIIDLDSRDETTPLRNTILMQICLRPCSERHELDDVIDLLVKHGANLNYRNTDYETALTLAIGRDDYCKVTKLLWSGAAVNAPNKIGETPLMRACRHNYHHIVYRLLEYGADFNARDDDKKTAFDVAKEIAENGGGDACIKELNKRSEYVSVVFHKKLRLVLPKDDFEIKRIVFPLHCYALRECNKFAILFSYDQPPPKPSADLLFVLAIARAKFTPDHQVEPHFWGRSPVIGVELNGAEQKPLTNEGKFMFSMWPIVQGQNRVVISCNDDCLQSKFKLLIQAYGVRVLKKNL